MQTKPQIGAGGESPGPRCAETAFTGYFFRMPSEVDVLTQLSPAELKAYLIVTHAIQRDCNAGLLAISQVAKRAHLSERHARKAIDALCQRRLLIRVNRVTGIELTRKEDWNGRTVKYANPIQWKQKDTSNPTPTGQRSGPEDDNRNGVTENNPANSERVPVGDGNLRPVGQRHSEYSECPDLKTSLDGDGASAFSEGLSFREASGDKLINGFASAKSAEGSPGSQQAAARKAKTENQKADPKADPPAVPAREEESPSMRAKPKPNRNGLDITNVRKWLSAFMDGEDAPPKLVSWISELSAEHSLQASDIHRVLDAAWKRSARPGQKNAPRTWNWFYEVLRAAFIPGYAARLPEVPAAPRPEDRAGPNVEAIELPDVPDSLVASYICKCGAEIRQYADRVVGTCTCSRAKPIEGITRMPTPGKRSGAGGRP